MSTNRYGVDVTYFQRWFERSLKDLSNYKPDELARELARMARTADKKVLSEKEFSGSHCWEIGSKETCDCPDCGKSLVEYQD